MEKVEAAGAVPIAPKAGFFGRALGLDRPELKAWVLYDWANSAFYTTIVAAVLPVYFADVVAVDLAPNLRTAYWAYASSAALTIAALTGPVFGAMADRIPIKKRMLAAFTSLGVLATAALALAARGDWLFCILAFMVANIGASSANQFYESLLPHVARPDEVDRVSSAGYAVGYIGGVVLLAINLSWILKPAFFGFASGTAACQAAFISVALWWAVFTIPIMLKVREPEVIPTASVGLWALAKDSAVQCYDTLREVRQFRNVFIFLLAFWFYSDGIGTIIKMATIYGKEVGIGSSHLMGALLCVQFVGIPAAVGFGYLAVHIGTKRAIYISLVTYTFICGLGYFMREVWHFWLLALAVGLVQGGAQALSRSLFTSMVPKSRSAEFFGFFSVSSRFAGIIGPFLFGIAAQAAGESRISILSVTALFLIGIVFLTKVNVKEGQLEAQRCDAATHKGAH